MIKNFCDKCGKVIPLNSSGHIELLYHTIDRHLPGCGTKTLYYDLCDKCEIEIKHLIDEFFKWEVKGEQ